MSSTLFYMDSGRPMFHWENDKMGVMIKFSRLLGQDTEFESKYNAILILFSPSTS